jgi:hypothetical protein
MTSEEKQLLIKDLCARLPYGVKVHIEHDVFYDERDPYDRTLSTRTIDDFTRSDKLEVNPYLRPMSSLTAEERAELNERYGIVDIDKEVIDFGEFPSKNTPMYFPKLMSLHTWFIKNHIDIHGLIPQGLALAAPEGMYGD